MEFALVVPLQGGPGPNEGMFWILLFGAVFFLIAVRNGGSSSPDKYCSNCGNGLDSADDFCTTCGHPGDGIADDKRMCTDCQSINTVDDNFCSNCGNPFEG
jgi:predicted amidophosphoribosyltransferase